MASTGVTSATQQETVIPAGASTLTVTQQPAPTTITAGVAFTTQPIVTVKDQFGNLVANGTSVAVTETSGLGNVNGTTTVTTTAGVATFSGLSITNTGSTTLTFTANSHTGASVSITVNPAGASKLVMKTEPPSSVTVSTAFSAEPAVYVEDLFLGNVLTERQQ